MAVRAHRRLRAAVALSLLALAPTARAACTGGAVSGQAPPVATFLRSYRAEFVSPTRLAVDAAGNLYVADPGAARVVVRAPNGRVLARAATAGRPVSVAVGAAGRIYVGNGADGSVTAYDSDWHPLFQLGKGAGEFGQPSDLAVDATSGNVYAADSAAQSVRVYAAGGSFLRSFGGPGEADGTFKYPVGVFVDAAARRVLVADQLNYRIQVFDVDGNFVACFGTHGSDKGQFNMPQGVTMDGAGRIYVSDSVEGRIQVLDRSGDFVGYVGDFGEGAGQLRIPLGMVVDPSGRLFVASADNGRLEVFGLDEFADPETVVPAVVRMQPESIERTRPATTFAARVEVPGYRPDRIDRSSVVANGVAAAPGAGTIGDTDGNGVADLRVEFAAPALLDSLPAEGVAAVLVSGNLGDKRFEGSATVHVLTCGPDAVCQLGDADPQCNEAVCEAGAGCTVRRKGDGTACEDGSACTMDDACEAGVCAGTALICDDGNLCTDDGCEVAGGCAFTANTAPCDDADACTSGDTCAAEACAGVAVACDDGSPCTDDACDATTGCVFTPNAAPCDDADPCTAGDTCTQGVCVGKPISCNDGNPCTDDACDVTAGCTHAANDGPCDDGDPGTVEDSCNGAGLCGGRATTGQYAVLQWPLDSPARRVLTIGSRAAVRGDVCGENVLAGISVALDGNAVAWSPVARALTLRPGDWIAGNAVSGGGRIAGLRLASVDGVVDDSGAAAELAQCFAARYRAAQRLEEFLAQPARPEAATAGVRLQARQSARIAAGRHAGSRRVFLDVEEVDLAAGSRLAIGGGSAQQVVVRVHGRLRLGHTASIVAQGMPPQGLVIVVEGTVDVRGRASVDGSLLGAARVRVGRNGFVRGAVLGRSVKLAPSASVDLQSFAGW